MLFVDASASGGSGDGASWATAFSDLQEALAFAEDGDEVWVAEGVYHPSAAEPVDRHASFVLHSGVQLYGGFAGSEGTLAERNPTMHETVLSGDLGVAGDVSDNAYHVVVASGTNAATILDGFTVTGGYGDGASPRNRGGGIYAEDGSLTVRHCRIEANRVVQTDGNGGGAGAFFGGSGEPRFEGVAFVRNAAVGAIGGGLWLLDVDNAEVRDSEFVENTARYSGGAEVRNTPSVVVGTDFVRNTSGEAWGGLRASSDVTLINAGFYGNVALGDSDGVSIGGGASCSENLTATNVVFVGNVATLAAGLSVSNDTYTLTNVTFASNQADEQGGGIRFANGSDVWLNNAIFWGNTGGDIDATSGSGVLRRVLTAEGCPPSHPFTPAVCEGLLDADPLFERMPDPGPDAVWGTPDDDYGDLRLRNESPAVNFGLEDFLPPDAFDLDSDGDTAELLPLDLAGEVRMIGVEVDLGAYEYPVVVAAEPGALPGPALDLAAYPNPSRGPVALSVELGRSQEAEVAVFDALGRRVAVLHAGALAAGQHTLTLETVLLPAGVYVVRLQGEAASTTQRLTVLR